MLRPMTAGGWWCIAVLATRATCCAAATCPMQPLDVGDRWEYVTSDGQREVKTIVGQGELRGPMAYVEMVTEGVGAGTRRWLVADDSGYLRFAGWSDSTGQILEAYDPPLAICGPSPKVGDALENDTMVYDVRGFDPPTPLHITFQVVEAATVSVPAGTFEAVGCTAYAGSSSEGVHALPTRLTPDGRRIGPLGIVENSGLTWFALGIGVVEFYGFRLTSFGLPTPTTRSTWGAIKAAPR